MQSSSLSIPVDGSEMPCYLARPDGNASAPAVIVLQEIFGVNAEVKRISDLLASAGYVALAPNYYHRTHPDLNEPYNDQGLQNGFAAAGQVTRATIDADISAVRDWLNAQDFVAFGRIATWGFCFGGTVAFHTATLPGIEAAICFYGGNIGAALPSGEPEMLADTPQLRAPLLLAFGGQDDYIPQATIDRITSTLKDAGKRFQLQVYPNVGHAFFRNSSENMDSKEVADAWDLVQSFLKQHLGEPAHAV